MKGLIVEAGGTFARWYRVEHGKISNSIVTSGINATTGCTELNDALVMNWVSTSDRIHYYGAGVNNIEAVNALRNDLFSATDDTQIYSDLEAVGVAARKASIIAILGTGSNVGFWDGDRCNTNTISLGWAMGDSGSAAAIGKALMTTFAYKKVPQQLRNQWNDFIGKPMIELVGEIYRSPRPGAALGALAKFCSEVDHEITKQIVINQFESFIVARVVPLAKVSNTTDLVAVGGVATAFSQELAQVLSRFGYTLTKSMPSAMDDLEPFIVRWLDGYKMN